MFFSDKRWVFANIRRYVCQY